MLERRRIKMVHYYELREEIKKYLEQGEIATGIVDLIGVIVGEPERYREGFEKVRNAFRELKNYVRKEKD